MVGSQNEQIKIQCQFELNELTVIKKGNLMRGHFPCSFSCVYEVYSCIIQTNIKNYLDHIVRKEYHLKCVCTEGKYR